MWHAAAITPGPRAHCHPGHWLTRRSSARSRELHARSRGTYGAPPIHAELRLGLEVRVGRKRVARRMREHRLQGVHRRRLGGLTRRDPQAVPASDLVDRNFTSAAPDRLWVADLERHEAFLNRAVMKGHRRRLVAAGRLKLRAA